MALLMHPYERGPVAAPGASAGGEQTDHRHDGLEDGIDGDGEHDEHVVLTAPGPRPVPGDVLCLLDASQRRTRLGTVLKVAQPSTDGRMRAWIRPWPERIEYSEISQVCSTVGIRLDGADAVEPRAAAEFYRLLRIGRRPTD